MTNKSIVSLLLWLSATVLAASAQDLQTQVINEMNAARTDPQGYCQRVLLPLRATFTGNVFTTPSGRNLSSIEGAAAVDECIAYMTAAKPVGKLRQDTKLEKAAEYLASLQSKTGEMGHNRPEGKGIEELSGYANNGENVQYGSSDARDIVCLLLIDDGVSDRGHRENIMYGVYDLAGVANAKHPRFKYCTVIDFAVSEAKTSTAKNEEANSYKATTGFAPKTSAEKLNFGRQILDEVNFVRTDPARYAAEVLEPFIQKFEEDGKTYYDSEDRGWQMKEGVKAVRECIAYLKSAQPVGALTYSTTLQEAAEALTNAQSKSGATDHNRGGKTLKDYAGNAPTGECMTYTAGTPREIIVRLLLDDGFPARTNRKILLDPSFIKLGASMDTHPDYINSCVIDLAGAQR